MATLFTHLDLVSKHIIELEVPCKKNYRYITRHEHKKSKDYEGGKVNEIMSLILHEVKRKDRVLNDIKENVSLLN